MKITGKVFYFVRAAFTAFTNKKIIAMFQRNAINWFEIPVADFDRAKTFYETILGFSLEPMDMPGFKMLMFPTDDRMGTSGALIYAPEFYQPSANGTMVYLNGNPDLKTILDRVEAAGGKIAMPKTQITEEIGFMAAFFDSEGNRVALHSGPQQ
jgi:predicted enzyme related to lactoylglutathione lyase